MNKSILLKEINNKILEDIKDLNLFAVVLPFQKVSVENIDMIRKILGEKVSIEVLFTCFEGKKLQDKFPEAIPVEVEGKEINISNYHPVSPINLQVHDHLLTELKKLKDMSINTVWLNHLHFPTKWWVNDPQILDTDYSDMALSAFSRYIGEDIEGSNLEEKFLHIDGSYYHEWLLFKSSIINSFVERVKSLLNPSGIKVGAILVPWEEKDYRAAITRVLGQDHSVLVDLVDKLALSLPYNQMGMDNEWVKAKINYFWHLGRKFTSFVDVDDNQNDFEQLIPTLLQMPSDGFVLDSYKDLTSYEIKYLK